MDLSLEGKVAVVTGGSRGIGRAIARSLAAEGCSLGLVARGREGLEDVARELSSMGVSVEIEAADVTDAEAHDRAIARLAERLGGIDVAVANAGGSKPGNVFAPDEVWRQVWELNFLSAVRLFRAVVPHMEKRGGGSFVAISSISGLEAFGRASYVAAKSALHGFAKAASIEVASRGIRVNCVAPGAIWFPGGSWDWRQKNDPETFARVERSIPFRRLGRPEEIGDVVAFLASPRSSWVTGAVIVVDGGQTHRIG